MSAITKLIILGVVLVIAGAFLWLYAPALFSNFQNQKLHLGSEIKHYPLDGISFTVTNWTLVQEIDLNVTGITGLLPRTPKNGDVYVIVNFTFRNIGDAELAGSFDNFYELASVTSPLLNYGNYYAQAYPSKFNVGNGLYWGQTIDLMPNQTANGALVYEILDGYTPSSLLYPNKDSPKFVINLTN
jgi:hypothetical protein